ncbi:MAG: cation diffusion facilitator family transporter, partial [Planctomycetota bacterium]
MADPNSKTAVIMAIIGNGLITIAKGVATAMSGSGAMLAETIHSLIDTLNQCLMLLGQRRSVKPANDMFPYGFGPENNFWCLLASIGVFIFGGGMTIQHGVHALKEPHMPGHIKLIMIVLVIATIIDSFVTGSVLKSLAKTRGDRPWMTHIKKQNATTIAVLLEDSAAVLGCLLAMGAVGLCVATDNPIWDAIAQILIGLMLALVGLILIRINWAMLIGKSVDKERRDEIIGFLNGLNGIDHVTNLKTRQLTNETFML